MPRSYPSGRQPSALPAAGVPVTTAVPCGFATPVPVNPIGDTGCGVFVITITAPSRKPATLGWKLTVNPHEEPGSTTWPLQRSSVSGNVPAGPSHQECLLDLQRVIPVVGDRHGPERRSFRSRRSRSRSASERRLRSGRSAPWPAAARAAGCWSCRWRSSSSAWKVPGAGGLKPMPIPQLLLVPNSCCSQFWPYAIENTAASGPTIAGRRCLRGEVVGVLEVDVLRLAAGEIRLGVELDRIGVGRQRAGHACAGERDIEDPIVAVGEFERRRLRRRARRPEYDRDSARAALGQRTTSVHPSKLSWN